MAESPSHKFGQIIGHALEACIGPKLEALASKHGLYLDKKGLRTARSGQKVSWVDKHGNKHDLDFVLERGGTDQVIGAPAAFIETAWRRYTKHSRNKAQEIQAAILPLVESNWKYKPFMGVILAGVFTEEALTQLESSGFVPMCFPYDTVIHAFAHVGIDANFDEETPASELFEKVCAWDALPAAEQASVALKLGEINAETLQEFLAKLEQSLTRQVASVRVLPLHGATSVLDNVGAAISFIERYDETTGADAPLAKYEVRIDFNHGARIEGQFLNKHEAVDFLDLYRSPLRSDR